MSVLGLVVFELVYAAAMMALLYYTKKQTDEAKDSSEAYNLYDNQFLCMCDWY